MENMINVHKTQFNTESRDFLIKEVCSLFNAIPKKRVLILTFTDKAEKEIIEQLCHLPKMKKRLYIGTFYKFCQYMLDNHGTSIGLEKMPYILKEEKERVEMVEKAINYTYSLIVKYKKFTMSERREFCYSVLDFISEVKRNFISVSELEHDTENSDRFLTYLNYETRLNAQHAIDSDDLIMLAHDLLIISKGVAGLYRRSFVGIFVDQAQNLTKAQYYFLAALANGDNNNIMLTGSGEHPFLNDNSFINSLYRGF